MSLTLRSSLGWTGSGGEPVTADVNCFLSTDLPDALPGSVLDIGFEAALKEIVVADTEPASCFVLGDDNFYLADVADCGDDGALMFVGSFDLDDGPYPGEDAIREVRALGTGRPAIVWWPATRRPSRQPRGERGVQPLSYLAARLIAVSISRSASLSAMFCRLSPLVRPLASPISSLARPSFQ
jgi:hypothetical protein